MDCIIGIKGKDFVLLATDTVSARSIVAMKHDLDKTYQLSDKLVMAVSGESGDTNQFAEYIAKNIQLYKMRNGYELSPQSAANFTRRNMAEALRSRSPYYVNLLLAGYDNDGGPSLHFLDYLASSVEVPFAVHGYGSFFSLSVMDRYYHEDITKDEAIELLGKCIQEIKTRFIINMPTFKLKCIDKDGVHSLTDLTAQKL